MSISEILIDSWFNTYPLTCFYLHIYNILAKAAEAKKEADAKKKEEGKHLLCRFSIVMSDLKWVKSLNIYVSNASSRWFISSYAYNLAVAKKAAAAEAKKNAPSSDDKKGKW